ncbi:hypothetical protein SDC9_195496 [bioreactor metagenome]|uniref:Uncharacterized protein n=1 Tax=bioreactor metagenome TaxID=1076179 RepID=A0A645IAQ7_9ZZZZ
MRSLVAAFGCLAGRVLLQIAGRLGVERAALVAAHGILHEEGNSQRQRKPADNIGLAHDLLHVRRAGYVGRQKNDRADECADDAFEKHIVVGLARRCGGG